MRTKQKGFSLIELLIVVAIILIIAAIAIPNLLRAKMAANESSAVESLRSMMSADATYNSTWGQNQFYAISMATLGGAVINPTTCAATNLIDPVLGGATTAAKAKSGYFFTYNGTGTAEVGGSCPGSFPTFWINGSPSAPGSTGQSTFCVDQTGVIRKDPTGTAFAVDGTTAGCLTTQGAPL